LKEEEDVFLYPVGSANFDSHWRQELELHKVEIYENPNVQKKS
jgi:hypothetical protein